VPSWNPDQYLRFGSERLRPALDLLARIPLETPQSIYDLGCGPGTVTVLLKSRWPGASVVGVDSSVRMLEKARALGAGITWRDADLGSWAPDAPADLLFSNATLHWLDQHERLFPRLLASLKANGVLAVQMPHNFAAVTHTAITEAVRAGPWRERLAPHLRQWPVLDLHDYYAILSSHAARLDLWETTYLHVLEGDDPVVEWVKGSALRPWLERLQGAEAEAFLDVYRTRIREAYPRRQDAKTLLPFKRLFIIAVR
jgi:trans-aconitate 2-methyltransferase